MRLILVISAITTGMPLNPDADTTLVVRSSILMHLRVFGLYARVRVTIVSVDSVLNVTVVWTRYFTF